MTIQNQTEKIVMGEIKSGRVKLRSKYLFLVEKFGLGSALILTVLLAILFFNLVLFYLKSSDNLGYLSFGNGGIFAFLQSFPYLLVISFIILIFIAGFIIKMTDFAYKKPFGYVAVGLVSFVLLCGGILTFTNIAERIEMESYNPRMTGRFMKPFLRGGLGERAGGVAGRVVKIQDDYILIQTPNNLIKLFTTKIDESFRKKLQPGMFIMAIGQNTKDGFEVRQIRIVSEQENQMVRHGVHRRFGNFINR
ncbi:MAG: hypothetical protein WCV83_04135 [Candidatus Magasanikbacteria bacterium]